MRRNLPGRIGLLFPGLLIFTGLGCSKDDDNPPSKTALLTSAPWTLIAETYHGDYDGDGVQDPVDYNMFADYVACEKDNLVKLNPGGTGTFDEGATKCDSDDPQTEEVEWLFKENETIIKIQQGSITIDYKILELDIYVLKVEFTDPFSSSNGKITESYIHAH